MPHFVRPPFGLPNHSLWIVPILAGIICGCLLALLANSVTELCLSSASKAATVAAAADPKPAIALRKTARYEAVRSNWQHYRESHGISRKVVSSAATR